MPCTFIKQYFQAENSRNFFIYFFTTRYSSNPNIFTIMSYHFSTSNSFHYLLYCQVKPVDYHVTDLGGQLLNTTEGAKGLMAADLT